MKTNFTHGPGMNPDDYEIGPYVLNEAEALEVAYSIIGHFRPKVSTRWLSRNEGEIDARLTETKRLEGK